MRRPGRRLGGLLRLGWEDLAPAAGSPLLPLNVSRFPLAGWLPHVVVAAGAAVFAGSSWHILLTDYGVANGWSAALGISHASAVLLCLYWPMSGWWVSLTLVVLTSLAAASARPDDGPLLAGPSLSVHLAVLALVALRVRPRAVVELWLLTLTTAVGLAIALPGRTEFPGLTETAVLSGAVLIAAAALRGRGEALRRLAHLERIGEQERARHALLEERTRIARELHDVVAHHMSVVAIQAEAAPYRVPDPPAELTRSFATIRGNALEALAELHRILGLLRNQAELDIPAPQPSLSGLEDLISGVREAGLAITCEVSGTPRPTPAGVELSAYRIVQESLSNVLRHAPGADARVEVAFLEDRLEVRVANGPSPMPVPFPSRQGHGLVGMRERAGMLGGHLEAGQRLDGGYAVTAVLPLPELSEGEDGP